MEYSKDADGELRPQSTYRLRRLAGLCLCILTALCLPGCSNRERTKPPFPAREALRLFRIDERFKVELYASEPMLDGPVAMAFDERGRTFVLESPVFPLPEHETGRLKLLEDRNHDGLPDRAVPTDEFLPSLLKNWRSEAARTTDGENRTFVTGSSGHVQMVLADSTRRSISDHGKDCEIFPLTEDPVYPVLTLADHMTSACAIAYYSHAAINGFERALFTADPVHNLVHCDLLSVDGPIPVARRAEERAEFLASADPWFRPVGFFAARDGSLYVVDYYAPIAAPTEILDVGRKPAESLLRSGGKGRIYRITASDAARVTGSPAAIVVAKPAEEPAPTSAPVELPGAPHGLEKMIADPRTSENIQAAAVRALGNVPGEAAGEYLLSKWRAMTAKPRAEAVEAMFKSPARIGLFLDRLEKGQIPLWCLDDAHRVRNLAGSDSQLARRTRSLLQAHDPSSDPVTSKYQAALDRLGDRNAGEAVYRSLCGRCHTFRGGSNYGPDLFTVSSRPLRRILIDILLPSDSIASGRELYMIDLSTGGSVEGVIGSQTETALKILHDESRQETVLRKDIQRLLMADFSPMPVDLASQISVREMADLLRFLTSR